MKGTFEKFKISNISLPVAILRTGQPVWVYICVIATRETCYILFWARPLVWWFAWLRKPSPKWATKKPGSLTFLLSPCQVNETETRGLGTKHSMCGLQLQRTSWVFPEMVGFPPISSILIGFSIINHPFWRKHPYFWKHPVLNEPQKKALIYFPSLWLFNTDPFDGSW